MTCFQEMSKRELRNKVKLTAAALPKSTGTAARLAVKLPQWKLAKTIFCYISYAYEPSTLFALSKALKDGKVLCVPLCEENNIMTARRIYSLTELTADKYGIPAPTRSAKIISAHEIDVAIIPCLCADKNNNRLGKGLGYYDRFLADNSTCYKIILCRKELFFDILPNEPHDIKADLVLVE